MSTSGSPDSVHKTIVVRCPVEVAFRVWTEQIDRWWPKSHSRSGDPGTLVFLERQVGGRLYERTSDGVEYTWGEVLVWEPTRHFAYLWYLGSSAEQPTRVDVRFRATAEGLTQVEVTHRGPELIGELWARTNPHFAAAWEHVLARYSTACASLEQENVE
jgi:activator of Hsp90 ATPase-like protein